MWAWTQTSAAAPLPTQPPCWPSSAPRASARARWPCDLAQRHRGEIINADSRQVYRGMDVGTAKPSPEDRAAVPHHLYDVADPDGEFSLAHFLALAREAIAAVQSSRRAARRRRRHGPVRVGVARRLGDAARAAAARPPRRADGHR